MIEIYFTSFYLSRQKPDLETRIILINIFASSMEKFIRWREIQTVDDLIKQTTNSKMLISFNDKVQIIKNYAEKKPTHFCQVKKDCNKISLK